MSNSINLITGTSANNVFLVKAPYSFEGSDSVAASDKISKYVAVDTRHSFLATPPTSSFVKESYAVVVAKQPTVLKLPKPIPVAATGNFSLSRYIAASALAFASLPAFAEPPSIAYDGFDCCTFMAMLYGIPFVLLFALTIGAESIMRSKGKYPPYY